MLESRKKTSCNYQANRWPCSRAASCLVAAETFDADKAAGRFNASCFPAKEMERVGGHAAPVCLEQLHLIGCSWEAQGA